MERPPFIFWNHFLPLRRMRLRYLGVGALLVVSCFFFVASCPPVSRPAWVDEVDEVAVALRHPTFSVIKDYERNLPQHSLPPSKGHRPRYLFFPHASWGSGWNNVFQEQLMNTHLAYLSQRAYVFPDYIPRDHPPFPDTLDNGTRHMLHVPMNAFVSGPTGGGPFSADGPDSLVRRSVSEKWWNVVCPPHEVVVVNVGQTMRELGLDDAIDDGGRILTRWASKLLRMEASCVSIEGSSVFNYILFAYRILSAWPSYGPSPTLKYFAWSSLVTGALSRNFHLLSTTPRPPKYLLPSAADVAPYKLTSFKPLHASEPPIPGLLAIHVRRGDYEGHCQGLSFGLAEYNAWNNLGTPKISQRPEFVDFSRPMWPQLPDYLEVPEGDSPQDARFKHCLPTAEEIVARVGKVREEAMMSGTAPNLRRIYVATNGQREWMENLTALLKADGWIVSTSFDMELTLEERAVGQAVDMAIMTAAEAFIGVGFSSMSSNVVQIRLAGGRDPRTIRFW
ncbi:SH3 and PX-domain-containing 3 [Favolaschia claudopus]|uniref:SH3 and PX-domain-containing 3 n=1 Tax=Favolaschia claudopus TaxID=2862362 RepID=A0AAW0D1K0_9AGAR